MSSRLRSWVQRIKSEKGGYDTEELQYTIIFYGPESTVEAKRNKSRKGGMVPSIDSHDPTLVCPLNSSRR